MIILRRERLGGYMKYENFHFDAIIFSLDGTLYDNSKIKFTVLLKNLFDTSKFQALLKTRSELAGKDFQDTETFYHNFFSLLGKYSKTSRKEIREWYLNDFYPSYRDSLRDKFFPREGVLELLKHLNNKSIRIGCVSDYLMVPERLDVLGIPTSYFETMLSSEEVGALKPNPRVYAVAANKMDVEPSKILVVGDHDKRDGEAAIQAGMNFQLIEHYGAPSWICFRDTLLNQ